VIVSSLDTKEELKGVRDSLDKEFLNVALPAFVALAADPLASLVDAYFVGTITITISIPILIENPN
jgi:Na+-driven multidrug efflux pump